MATLEGHWQPCSSEKQLTVLCSSQQPRSTMGSFPQSKSYGSSGFWLPASENKLGRKMMFVSSVDVSKPGVEVAVHARQKLTLSTKVSCISTHGVVRS